MRRMTPSGDAVPYGTSVNVSRLVSILATVLAAMWVLCVVAIPTSAGGVVGGPELTKGSRYLALGDSVTFGFQEQQVVPAPDYQKARSFVAFPQLLSEDLRVKVTNAACPGETSASLINASAQSNGCENSIGSSVGYRTAFPLHVRYRGSQLAFALSFLRGHRDVRLVSLMVGANDFFLCQRTTTDSCLSATEQRAVFARIARNVRRIVSAIRGKARYRGQIVIVNYWSPSYASSVVSGVSRALDAAIDRAGRRFGVEVADGYGEFRKATRIFGGDPCAAGLVTRLSSGGCGVHPTYAGHALLAQAVLKAIRH